MLSVKKAKAVEAPASPADPMQPFRDLQARIEAFKAELDTYIDEHCRVITSGASGVPFENIKMMVTSRINCQCAITTKILNEKAITLEMEAREKEK